MGNVSRAESKKKGKSADTENAPGAERVPALNMNRLVPKIDPKAQTTC
jgi:hypothetical protein